METVTTILTNIGAWIPKALFWLLKFSVFLILSILVLPSMFVMLFLQEPWEKMLSEITSI